MKTTRAAPALLILAGLAGCAPIANLPPPVTEAQMARCDERAIAGSAAQLSGFVAGAARADIQRACLRATALENRDQLERRLGVDLSATGPQWPVEQRMRIVGFAEACGAPEDVVSTYVARHPQVQAAPPEQAASAREAGRHLAAGAEASSCAFARALMISMAAHAPAPQTAQAR